MNLREPHANSSHQWLHLPQMWPSPCWPFLTHPARRLRCHQIGKPRSCWSASGKAAKGPQGKTYRSGIAYPPKIIRKHLCKCLVQNHMLCSKQETQYTIEWLPSVPSSVPLRLHNKVWLCQWNLRYEMNGISCNSILGGLDGIKKIGFNLFYFQAKVYQGPNGKKCTNTIRGAVLSLPCDHFLNTLRIDAWDPQNKTFVASTSHTNRKLPDRSNSGPRDMPLWPCRPHDTIQLQRFHSQEYVGSNARVLRCITKNISPVYHQLNLFWGEVVIWGMHHCLGGSQNGVLGFPLFIVSTNPFEINKLVLGHCSQNHHHMWTRYIIYPKWFVSRSLDGGFWPTPKSPVWKFQLAHQATICCCKTLATFSVRYLPLFSKVWWKAAMEHLSSSAASDIWTKNPERGPRTKEEWKGSGREWVQQPSSQLASGMGDLMATAGIASATRVA